MGYGKTAGARPRMRKALAPSQVFLAAAKLFLLAALAYTLYVCGYLASVASALCLAAGPIAAALIVAFGHDVVSPSFLRRAVAAGGVLLALLAAGMLIPHSFDAVPSALLGLLSFVLIVAVVRPLFVAPEGRHPRFQEALFTVAFFAAGIALFVGAILPFTDADAWPNPDFTDGVPWPWSEPSPSPFVELDGHGRWVRLVADEDTGELYAITVPSSAVDPSRGLTLDGEAVRFAETMEDRETGALYACCGKGERNPVPLLDEYGRQLFVAETTSPTPDGSAGDESAGESGYPGPGR